MPIKVAITDDHPLVIEGLQNALSAYPTIVVAGVYNSANALLKGLKKSIPDVLLLDIQLADTSGNELAPILIETYPHIRILVLTSMDATSYVKDMMEHGCMGYLLKSNTDRKMLANAIEQVHAGKIFLDPSLKEDLLYGILKEQKAVKVVRPKLTLREQEILQLIVAEYSNQEIADKLCLSLRTIEAHRYNLIQKLNVKNTVGLVKVAMQMGLVD